VVHDPLYNNIIIYITIKNEKEEVRKKGGAVVCCGMLPSPNVYIYTKVKGEGIIPSKFSLLSSSLLSNFSLSYLNLLSISSIFSLRV
jgi:hypothetical protein